MSIFGAMFSGVSGLNAQSQALGMISDNISNVNTVGYKGTEARFSTLVTQNATSNSYSPGGVRSNPFQFVDRQGLLQSSSSQTDIAIVGGGFFVVNEVSNPGLGDEFTFTRAGSFAADSQGFLRNTGGFYLQGWPTDSSGVPTPANLSTLDSLESININGISGSATATTEISVGANLPATAAVGDNANSITTQLFDSLGVPHNLSFTFVKKASNEWDITVSPPTGTAVATVSNSAGDDYASVGQLEFTAQPSDGDFIMINDGTNNVRYEFDSNGSVTDAAGTLRQVVIGADLAATVSNLRTAWLAENVGDTRMTQGTGTKSNTLTFTQSAAGAATTFATANTSVITQSAAGTTPGTFAVPALTVAGTAAIIFDSNGVPSSFNIAQIDMIYSNGASDSSIALEFGTVGQSDAMTQFASSFTTYFINQNGVRFGTFSGVTIGEDGIVTALFDNGQSAPIYKIPIVTFANPNGLFGKSGNVYAESDESGQGLINTAGSGAAGSIASGALEASTVDIANEFTNMIITQQAYSAAARIISTADEMLDEVLRIAR